jgi:hypothetical protein
MTATAVGISECQFWEVSPSHMARLRGVCLEPDAVQSLI